MIWILKRFPHIFANLPHAQQLDKIATTRYLSLKVSFEYWIGFNKEQLNYIMEVTTKRWELWENWIPDIRLLMLLISVY